MKTFSILVSLLCLLAQPAWAEQGKEINILIDKNGSDQKIIEINGERINLDEELDGLDMELHTLVKMLKSMSDEGNSDQAFIGILLEQDDTDSTGVNVIGITPDSPAQSAGIKAGDVIIGINGSSLAGDSQETPAHKLFQVLKNLKAAEKLELELEREGQQMSLSLIAAKRGDHLQQGLKYLTDDLEKNLLKRHESHIGDNLGGIELYPLNKDLGTYFDSDHGMLVLNIPQDKNLPLRSGDVILQIGGRTPSSPSQTWRILHSYDKGESIDLSLMRHGKQITVSLDKP